jgi:drug/metabolite transporter superfamily protein YnfA
MKQLHGVSPRLEARVAGVIYLFSILLGVVAMILNSRNMQALGGQTNLVAGALYTGLTVLFWDLFRPVSEWLSTSAAIFSLAGCWLPSSWYKAAHVSNFLFFGVYCLLIGYLILRSWFLPNAVGVLMACAGVCWLTTTWPWLARSIGPYTTLVGLVGEGTLMVYLLVKGLDERRWREQAKLA